MTALLALVLLATNPVEIVRETQADIIEQNWVMSESGDVVFVQWLSWSWAADGRLVCDGWRIVKDQDRYRPWGNDPRIILADELHVIRGKVFIQRAIVGDVEVWDRERWPVDKRRGINFRPGK